MASRLGSKVFLWKNCFKATMSKDCHANLDKMSSSIHGKSFVINTDVLSDIETTSQFSNNRHVNTSPGFGLSASVRNLQCVHIPCHIVTNNSKVLYALSRTEILRPLTRSYASDSSSNHKEEDAGKTNVPGSGILSDMFEKSEAQVKNTEQDLKLSATNNENESEQKNSSEKESEEKEASSAFLRSQRYAKWFLLGSFVIFTPMYILRNGAPKVDDLGNVVEDEYSSLPTVLQYIYRSWSELKLVKKDIVEPSSKKLLPDPLQEPYYQPPYTLVIELMDVFLRPVYDHVTGWRFKKRPGIDYFLSQVGPPVYEVVIFTRETGMTAYPLIDSMDSKGYIMYRLFRDAARYKSGFSLRSILQGELPKLDPYYQKDLRYLNRDLSKVIIVDCDKRAFENQPDNGLCLEKWDGSSTDTTLYDLASFLKTIGTSEVEDVRSVLRHYSEYSDPLEAFKLAQTRMQEDMNLNQAVKPKSPMFVGAGNTISSFFRRR